MIDTKAIRCAVLQLAFSGKLTERQEGDDSVENLLQRICSNKDIRQTENNPFVIPDHWAWVNLGDLYTVNPKVQADENIIAAFIPMERISAGFDGTFSYEEQIWSIASKNHTKFADGDVAFAKITPCFENRKSFIASGLPNGIGGGTTELIILRQKEILPQYTFYAILDERFIRTGVGTYKGMVGQQRVKLDILKKYQIPVPPLKEQQRVIEKIENAFLCLDAIDDLQNQYHDNMSVLKEKLINAAVQGKLTRQLPEDGTAEELYRQIQHVKQTYEKTGKTKNSIHSAPVAKEEMLFTIPKGWKWVRL